ncbi:suppressor of lurcher protein 1-like protein [Leptotrombidium deliense]|uniref:Suppressor of lurcher protein 1-like protein n=1 Tax=Leptotrombidium deliense TaxID=299467 RepID=A0A443SRK9_9ACAR|nr:suppressor of lurcher protein 1-like protein [Leptotrombidium deliense]
MINSVRTITIVLIRFLLQIYLQIELRVNALGASCQCIVYVETYGKEYGVFTSPNWPTPYDDNIQCLLYTFLAKSDQIIEITFDEFDVQKTSLDCIYGDFVKLYLHLNESAINEESSWNEVLCGKIADIEQTHYSADSSLIFEFHSDWRNANNTGFRGTYRFLNKRLFETDGERAANSRCNYRFESLSSIGNFTSALVKNVKGKFFSPQYPSTYPKGIRCSYAFFGQTFERVKLVFEHLRLQRSDVSCLNSPDVIYVHDGSDKSSPVIGQLCNTNAFVELVSTGPNLYIEFVSRSHFPGQGFKGKYLFESLSNANNKVNSDNVPSTVAITDCNFWFSSDTNKNGTFSSPNFPNPYPQNSHCVYNFHGRGKERVQIMFTEFSVYKPEDTQRDSFVFIIPLHKQSICNEKHFFLLGNSCDGADVVMVFITINGQKERVDNLCGDELPQQLMSNGPSITVEFKSLHSSHISRGFQANYKFVTNFGISTGTQDPQSVCGFNFRSTERSNGSFTSPNYPGLYPRDTECHYFFYGNQSEKVHITFAYFDVEGVTPCTTETASDYVEFSNYKSVDRKIPRHCGLKKPRTIDSDGDFFRVTFKSNDRFDGTGFEAFYQFRSPDDFFTVKQIRGISASVPVIDFSFIPLTFTVIKALFSLITATRLQL